MEYFTALRDKPMFLGLESVVAGHEHTSLSVITGQMPSGIYDRALPSGPTSIPKVNGVTQLPFNTPYTALGNANALAMWTYCFDAGESVTNRGTAENNYDCTIPGSSPAGWNDTAKKITTNNHAKTVEAVKWMAYFHGNASYYLPTHLERAGPVALGRSGFDVNDLRDFNNAAPSVAFGFETQPGHGAASQRGEYNINRNSGIDSIGGTTWGGTGIYGSYVGGVWDALLGEGRNYWFFASSDWHARGSFGADDRRTTADFLPGEYQRAYSLVRNNGGKINPQLVVDGMRSGNSFSTTGQLIDRLAFVACASYAGFGARTNAQVEAIALTAAHEQHGHGRRELRHHGREAQGAPGRGHRGGGGGA